MRLLKAVPVVWLSLSLAPLVVAAAAPTLQEILATLDKTGPAFRDMTASLQRTDYTPVLKETETQRGAVRMKRVSRRDIRLYVEFKEPDPQIVLFDRNEAQKYYPKLQMVEIYDLGRYRSLKDQFLLLGFGATGKELQENYVVKLAGTEQVAGLSAARLELVPRSPKTQEVLKKAELWVTPEGNLVQQKIYTSSVEYTFTYTDVRVNTGLPDEALKLSVPKDVKRERPLR